MVGILAVDILGRNSYFGVQISNAFLMPMTISSSFRCRHFREKSQLLQKTTRPRPTRLTMCEIKIVGAGNLCAPLSLTYIGTFLYLTVFLFSLHFVFFLSAWPVWEKFGKNFGISLGKFERSINWICSYIVLPFGLCYGHLIYFIAIWCTYLW
jgi:hypothetical protein